MQKQKKIILKVKGTKENYYHMFNMAKSSLFDVGNINKMNMCLHKKSQISISNNEACGSDRVSAEQ